MGNRFIAAGDYNAKHMLWGSRITLTKGRELLKSIKLLKLSTVSPGAPTYWPSDRDKIPDLIDFGVTKGISNKYIHSESCLELSSDHTPVIVTLQKEIIITPRKCVLCTKKTNWELFRNIINNTLNTQIKLESRDDIIHAVEDFVLTVQNAAWDSTPVDAGVNALLQYSSTIIDKVSEKRHLRKLWQKTRCPKLKTKLNKTIKELKELIHPEKKCRDPKLSLGF